MVRILPCAVVIFTILYLTRVLNALEDNLTSNYDAPSKDSDDVSPTAPSKNPSSGRFIRPSAWSKEENRDFKSSVHKTIVNKEHDMLFFGEDFNSWNVMKLFQYVASLLYDVNESNDGSLNNPTNDQQNKSQIATYNDPLKKSENNDESEMKNSTNIDIQNKPTEKIQNLTNKDTLDSRQLIENSKNIKQNTMDKDHSNKSAQDVKMQNASNNQMESVSALKNNQRSYDSVRIKDCEDSNLDKIISDNTADDTDDASEEDEADEYETYNDNEKEDKNGTDEDNRNENVLEDYFVIENNYEKDGDKNENEDKDADKNNDEDILNENNYENAGNTNKNEVEDDFVSDKNNNNQTVSNSQNPQTIAVLNESTRDSTTISPNFTDEQKYSETPYPNSQTDNQNNVVLEGAKAPKTSKEENTSPEIEITSKEFIDDYINNRIQKLPVRENEQSNNTEIFIPNSAGNKAVLKVAPTSENNFEKIPNFLTPLLNVNTTDLNIPFEKLRNTEQAFSPERNSLPLPIFNEDTKDNNINQAHLDESYSQNMQNTFTSTSEPTLSTQEDRKGIPLNLIPFQQNPYYTDLPNSFTTLQKDYNSFIQTPMLNFQNNDPSSKVFNAPDMNVYDPEITEPFQVLPNKAAPLQNEYYFNDPYANYNFRDLKTPDITNEKSQQFEQRPPIFSQQDMPFDFQFFPNHVTSNLPDEITYFTYRPEMPVNVQNVEKPLLKTENPSNYLISDNFQYDPTFNTYYNQEPPLANSENNLNKKVNQDQPDTMIPQNHINKIKSLNQESPTDNMQFQGYFPDKQILFPQIDIEKQIPQNEITSRAPPYEPKMKSEIPLVQKESNNTEFLLPQNGTNNAKEVPGHSFSTAEIKPENEPENEASPPVVPENNITKSSSPQTKVTSSKNLKNEPRGESTNFDEPEKTEQKNLNTNPDSGESPNYNNDTENDDEEEESNVEEEQSNDEEEQSNDEEEQSNDEEEQSNDEEEESNDDDEESNDDDEESNDDEEESNDDNDESNDGEEESNDDGEEPEYDDEESEASINLSDGTSIYEPMQTTENSLSTDTTDATESPTTQSGPTPSNQDENITTESPSTFKTQSEAVSPNPDKNFNSILEYLFKFSNNPLFAAIRDEERQTS